MLILRSRTFVLEHDILRGLFRLTRTSASLESPTEVDAAYGEVLEKLRAFDRSKAVLLADLRLGPRPAPPGSELENALRRNAALVREGFHRYAVLVRTAVGVLQTKRVVKGSTVGDIAVFDDEELALAYLFADD
jgi:hypothetical protein